MSSKQDEKKQKSGEKTREIPATFVDTFFLSRWADYVRITFGEGFGEDNFYRAAIVMPMEDAAALSRLLAEMIKEAEQEDKDKE